MARIVLKTGDLRPPVYASLTDSTSGVIDLTSASGVTFIMTPLGASVATVATSASIVTASTGEVAYSWNNGDTDTAGTYNGEFEVDWGSSVYQTFPADGFIEIEIQEDLGGSA